jgi:hypothetical protein
MVSVTVTGYNAWRDNEMLRQWFEVSFDTSVSPPEHCGYTCKSCWEQFDSNTRLSALEWHAESHASRGESPCSSPRPGPITGEQVALLFRAISENFDMVTPEVGTWKFRCRVCGKLIPHRTPHKELVLHARICAQGRSPSSRALVTVPNHISQGAFNKALREKFYNNPDDSAVRDQALFLMRLVRGSEARSRILSDVTYAAEASGHTSKEDRAEIAFCMGMQFGFELALSCPPSPPE